MRTGGHVLISPYVSIALVSSENHRSTAVTNSAFVAKSPAATGSAHAASSSAAVSPRAYVCSNFLSNSWLMFGKL